MGLYPKFLGRYFPYAFFVLHLTTRHIHLGYYAIKTYCLELFYGLLYLIGLKSGYRSVSLHTYTVNRNAGVLKSLGQIVHGMCLAVLIVTVAPMTNIVIIDIQLGIRIRLVCPYKRGIYVIITSKTSVPYRPATGGITSTYSTTYILFETLVYYIPLCNLALPVTYNIVDMILKNIYCLLSLFGCSFFSINSIGNPIRILSMPGKGMTANLHIVVLGKIYNTVSIIIELITTRLRCIKLHGVFKNHHIEVVYYSLAKQIAGTDSGINACTKVLSKFVGPITDSLGRIVNVISHLIYKGNIINIVIGTCGYKANAHFFGQRFLFQAKCKSIVNPFA